MHKKPIKSARKVARTGKKKCPRATVVTKRHAPGANPLAGSEERAMQLQHRAMQLKVRGHNLSDIANILTEEMELKEIPGRTTVFDWIQKAAADGMSGNKDVVEQYVKVFVNRSEEIVKKLIPFALDQFRVERTKMIDGEPTTIIDEDVMDERLKACAEIRKQGESVLRAMGVTRPSAQDGAEKGDNSGMKTFILQAISNHIEGGNPEKLITDTKTILELSAGDPIIDGL